MKTESKVSVWHPKVHFRFQETLCFFLLRARPFEKEVLFKKLQEFLSSMGLTGYQIYQIFGSYDVLLRIWLPVGEDRQFAEDLQDKISEVHHCNPFTSCWLHKCWVWGDMTKPIDQKFLDSLSLDEIRKIQTKIDNKLMEAALQGGLFRDIEKDIKNENGQPFIKFFVTIDFGLAIDTEQLRITVTEINKVVSSLQEEHVIERSVVYTGVGFAMILMKSETAEFYNIEKVIQEVSPHIKLLKGTTLTHIVANKDTIHYDDISERALQKMETKDQAVNAIVPELYESRDLSSKKKDEVESWIKSNVVTRELSKNHKDYLHDVLVGVIFSNTTDVLDGFFHAFIMAERYLRDNKDKFIGRTLGNAQLNSVYTAVGIASRNKALSLGDLLALYGKTLEKSENLHFPQVLIGGWQDVAELRNDVAHGKIGRLTGWRAYLDVFVDFLERFDKLQKVVENVLEK